MTVLLTPRPDNADTAEQPKARLGAFRPDIQGLRAIAVGVVVLYHAGVGGISGGYVGVDVFFVISGFLITGLLVNEADATGRISILAFYARRARRILPISSVALVAIVFASNRYLGYVRGETIATDARWAMGFMANIHYAVLNTNYLNAQTPPSPIQHYWSLAVEEQFYLVWPVLFLAGTYLARRNYLRALRVALLVITALSFVWSIRQTGSDANWAYFSPLTRGFELGAGALLALWAPSLRRANLPRGVSYLLWLLGLGAIGVAVVRFDAATKFPGAAAALPVAGATAVLAAGVLHSSGWHIAVLGWRPLRWLGDISYSLYLWHWPILIIAAQHAGHPLTLSQNLGLVAVGVALSAFTYYLIENPFRRSAVLRSRNFASLVVGAALVLVVSISANMVSALSPPASPAAQTQQPTDGNDLTKRVSTGVLAAEVLAGTSLTTLPGVVESGLPVVSKDRSPAYDDGCLLAHTQSTSPDCTFGDLTSPKTVVLFGDSHAAQWMPPLLQLANAEHFKLVVLTKSNCPAAQMELVDTVAESPFASCSQWRTNALDRISAAKPSLVIVASTLRGIQLPSDNAFSAKDQQYQSGLGTVLGTLITSAKRVAVLGDVPRHAVPAATCLSTHANNVQFCDDAELNATLPTFQRHEQITATSAGAQYVNVLPWLCINGKCPSVVANHVTAFDDSHLTASFSSHLTGVLGRTLGLLPG